VSRRQFGYEDDGAWRRARDMCCGSVVALEGEMKPDQLVWQ
jgi:hypothetical protein